MEFILLPLVVLWFFFIFRCFYRQSVERSFYKKMIKNPSELAVSSYIIAFEKSYCFLSGVVNQVNAVSHRNDLLRQAQGFEIIKNSSAVSDSAKEQLKSVFVANGVPIKL